MKLDTSARALPGNMSRIRLIVQSLDGPWILSHVHCFLDPLITAQTELYFFPSGTAQTTENSKKDLIFWKNEDEGRIFF